MLAGTIWRKHWLSSYLLLLSGLLIDADHLLADPVYDPLRCSMGFHPLHTWPAVLFYAGLCAFGKTRIVGIGLLLHMMLDSVDCLGMPGGISGLIEGFFSLPWIR